MFIITNKKSIVLHRRQDITTLVYCHYTRANLADSQPLKKKKKNLIQWSMLASCGPCPSLTRFTPLSKAKAQNAQYNQLYKQTWKVKPESLVEFLYFSKFSCASIFTVSALLQSSHIRHSTLFMFILNLFFSFV